MSLLSILFALCLSVCLFKGSKDNRERRLNLRRIRTSSEDSRLRRARLGAAKRAGRGAGLSQEQDMALYIAAAKAARMRDLQAHVVTAEGKHRR